jgi:hypothetical protein
MARKDCYGPSVFLRLFWNKILNVNYCYFKEAAFCVLYLITRRCVLLPRSDLILTR